MKLLTRNTYYFSVFSILAMVAAGFIFYFSIRTIVYRQIDMSLITEKTIIQDQLEETDTIPDFSASFGHLIEVRLLEHLQATSQIINDTNLLDVKSGSNLLFRHIKATGTTSSKTGYSINIFQVLDENQKLLDSIAFGMLILFLVLLSVSLIINYLISRKIFRPFFKAVSEAAAFNVLSDKSPELEETSITEFRQLNDVIEQMTTKMRKDYINLKEYNENFSHELQTPLAVIRSKLDILMQNKNLNKESINSIKSINEATSRLLKLNQGLLFISKIENQQFPETKEISLRKYVEQCLDNYAEITQLKGIRVELSLTDPGWVKMNEILTDVLISNLLSNAVRYNIDKGFIKCTLDSRSLTISNSGLPPDTDPEMFFVRFRKGSGQTNSVGLGLSIVKKIADHYGMKVSYICRGSVHEIKLLYM